MGVQSLFTQFLKFAGNVARLFTVLVEVTDVFLIVNAVTPCFLNGFLFIQFFLYPGGGKGKDKKVKAKKD